MFFNKKNTVYGDFGLIEAVSSLPLCLSGGDQMMPQGIIRNSLGDASRHHLKHLAYMLLSFVKL